MEFSGHTSRMTHDPTTVTARNQSFININQPINHLSILTHPERVESIIKLIGIFRYLHQSFGLLTFVRIIDYSLYDSSYQIVYNRLKEHLFKENPDVRYSKGAGSVFGHQLPNGDWLYHKLTPTQCSQIREKLKAPEIVELNSLKALLFEMVDWLDKPQKQYRQALEQGFNVEFHPVVSAKRGLEEQASEPKKAQKSSKPYKAKSSTDEIIQGPSSEAPVSEHPPNKCTGCGNKFEWQRAQGLPVCSKAACTFATHPDFNGTRHWASSEVAKAYATHVKNKKGGPVHSLTQNKRLVRDGNGKIVYPAKTEANEVSKLIYNNQSLITSVDSHSDSYTFSFSKTHTPRDSLSIDELLESGKSSYEVDEESVYSVANQEVSFDNAEFEPTLVATPNNINNLSVEREKINSLQLLANSLGDSSTSQQSNNINHNKPLVQCNIHGLVFNALLDACSTGPEAGCRTRPRS